MPALNQNFEIWAGDTPFINIVITRENQVVDISGTTIKWVVKDYVDAETNHILKTTGDGITIIEPANGKCQISLDREDTLNLSGKYYHEAELTDVEGRVSTILLGMVTIHPSGI